MTPGIFNFDMVRGTTTPLRFRLLARSAADPDVLVPIAYDDVRLSVGKETSILFRKTIRTDAGNPGGLTVLDPALNEIEWVPTPDETRMLSSRRPTPYEIEVRNGISQEVYLMGEITGIGGSNDD